MSYTARVLFLVALLIILGIIAAGYLKSLFGKPAGKSLHVPKGKRLMTLSFASDLPRTSYTYGQVFEATMDRAAAGQGRCALTYHGRELGSVPSDENCVQALVRLACRHDRVRVSACVLGIDGEGHPIGHLCLPDDGWFARALTAELGDRRD